MFNSKLWDPSQFSSVTQSCLTLCNPMDRSMPGFPVHHQLPHLIQTQVHWVHDAIQPSHPLSSPSPPAFNLSQYQGLFQWVGSSHQVAKVLEFWLQHQSFQWIFRTDFLYNWLVGSPCSPRDSQESSPTPQLKSINSWSDTLPRCILFLFGKIPQYNSRKDQKPISKNMCRSQSYCNFDHINLNLGSLNSKEMNIVGE